MKWIPDFDVRVTKGHVVLYVVITFAFFWVANTVYQYGYEDGYYDACEYYETYYPPGHDFGPGPLPHTPVPVP